MIGSVLDRVQRYYFLPKPYFRNSMIPFRNLRSSFRSQRIPLEIKEIPCEIKGFPEEIYNSNDFI